MFSYNFQTNELSLRDSEWSAEMERRNENDDKIKQLEKQIDRLERRCIELEKDLILKHENLTECARSLNYEVKIL